MKVLVNIEGLGRRATIETADLPKDTLVSITGDEQVDIAGAGDLVIGHISVPAPKGVADGQGTVETRFKTLFTAKAVGGALVAGVEVQAGAPAGTESTVAALTTGVAVGVVWKGAAANGTVEVFGY